MENLKLESELRTGTGKGAVRKLRGNGLIPAILYGQKKEPVNLAVQDAAIRTVLHSSETGVIDLVVQGEGYDEPINVIIRDVQRHPATGRLLHIDFQRIRYGEKIRVQIAISVVGTPRGVKEQGGILEHGIRSAQVMCLPRNIPESIEIDCTELMIGDSLKLKNVFEKHADMDFLDDPETTLAHVIPPIVEAVAAAEEPEEGVEAEPELVAKEKEGEAAPDEGGEGTKAT